MALPHPGLTLTESVITIRPARSPDLPAIAGIMFDAFMDKFGYIFRGQVQLGRQVFLEFYPSIIHATHLANILVATRGNEILGKLELHLRTSLPSMRDVLALVWRFARVFGPIRGIKKSMGLLMLIGGQVERGAAYVASVGVRPDAQNLHVGRLLMRAAEGRAVRHRCSCMTLWVVTTNWRARHLYGKLGYRDVSSFQLPFIQWLIGVPGFVYMRKPLPKV